MPAGQPVLKALQHLRKVEEGGVRGKTWPTEFVPKSWERRVIRNGIVDRHAWTLCLVGRVRGALRRRDVFAAPSLRFGDPRIGLLDGCCLGGRAANRMSHAGKIPERGRRDWPTVQQ